jgi:hypothetical protein
MTPTDDHPLYFLHIPKTAGTTLYNNMDDRFEVEHICPDRFLPQLLKRDPDSFKHFRFFRGHFGDALKHFVDRPLTYVTVLRDPVDRCISQFNDVRRVSNNFLYKRVNDLKMTFADFARDAETQIAINNLQARNLAFDWSAEQMDGNFNLIRRGIAGTSLGIPDDELLDIAKERLRQCAVVGILERFQDTNALLSYRFCWYPIRPPRRLNQSAQRLSRDTLDEATLDAVREKNQVDEALYRYAESLFTEQFNQMVDDLSEGRSADRSDQELDWSDRPHYSQEKADDPIILPALIQRYGQAEAQQSAFSPVLHVSMRHPAAGHNWHSREGLDGNCTPFRWTGPGTTSTLHVPLLPPEDAHQDSDSVTIQIYTIRAIAPDVLQSLSLTVNDTPVHLTVLSQWDTNTVFQGRVPIDAISPAPSLTCLAFSVNRTASMQTLAPDTPDQREVGLAISHVCLFPRGMLGLESPILKFFPQHDEEWVAVHAFVASHLKLNEAIAAPKEFLQRFPAQFQDITRLQPPSLSPSALQPSSPQPSSGSSSTDETCPTWAIVAKHWVHEIPAPTLHWMMDQMNLVFSNSVFMVLSTRSELDVISYFEDDPWSEAAEFLSAQVQPGDRLAAPREFMIRVPGAQFLGHPVNDEGEQEPLGSSSPTATDQRGAPGVPGGDGASMIDHADWLVLHKGMMDHYSDEVLHRAVRELRPVFANLVFVIFSGQSTGKRLSPWNRDLRAFWKVYLRRQWLHAIQRVTQPILQRPSARHD